MIMNPVVKKGGAAVDTLVVEGDGAAFYNGKNKSEKDTPVRYDGGEVIAGADSALSSVRVENNQLVVKTRNTGVSPVK